LRRAHNTSKLATMKKRSPTALAAPISADVAQAFHDTGILEAAEYQAIAKRRHTYRPATRKPVYKRINLYNLLRALAALHHRPPTLRAWCKACGVTRTQMQHYIPTMELLLGVKPAYHKPTADHPYGYWLALSWGCIDPARLQDLPPPDYLDNVPNRPSELQRPAK